MRPRVLLLQEDQASGGVSTIASTLRDALRQDGWQITVLALNQRNWCQRALAVKQSDVILASHNFKPAYVAWALGLLLHKPVVVWVHGPVQEVLQQAQASSVKRVWLRWLYRRLARWVFVSQASRDSFESFMRSPLGAQQRVAVIPNAVVPMALHDDSPRSGDVPSGRVQLAFIGRLSAEKRPQLLLDMLRLLPSHFTLTLVGDGLLRDELRHVGADLLANGRLTLAGQHAHGPALYTPWRLTLLASCYEGCPMMLLESFTMGVPCVGVPIAALREVVGVDAPYLLAQDATAQALADTVLAVCAMPPHQMQADMARVLARHQVQEFTQAWQAVLQEVATQC